MPQIIINGGNPLPGCPESPEAAHAWADGVNNNKDEHYEPTWSWDCGFKLDFDGPLISVSSRFYPPKEHYGPKWDGTVTIKMCDCEIKKRSFECDTLEELREKVEAFVMDFSTRLQKAALEIANVI